MWRFWIYRTTDPSGDNGSPAAVQWNGLGVDPLTRIDRSAASDDVTSVWRYHHHWMQTGQTPPPRPEAAALSSADRERNPTAYLHSSSPKAKKPSQRALARRTSWPPSATRPLAVRLLGQALYTTGRDAAGRHYGLIAVGAEATDTLLEAANSPIKWVRKAACTAWATPAPQRRGFADRGNCACAKIRRYMSGPSPLAPWAVLAAAPSPPGSAEP